MKVKVSKIQVMLANAALNQVRSVKGLPVKTAYALKRNGDRLGKIEKAFREVVQETMNEWGTEIDGGKLIPPEKYPELKKAITESLSKLEEGSAAYDSVKAMITLMESYEEEAKGKIIPKDKVADFNKEIENLQDAEEEIDLFPILMDDKLDIMLGDLPSGVVGDLWFMLEEPIKEIVPEVLH